MTKVAVPEPSAEIRAVAGIEIFDLTELGKAAGLTIGTQFITTDQAEAYAAAKVREALERAVKILDEKAMGNERATANCDGDPVAIAELRAAAWQISACARGVRALISD